MLYADDITITSTHTSMSATKKYIQPYLDKVFDWTQHNNLVINLDKTTCTLFIPDPAEYIVQQQSEPKHIQQSTTHGITPQGFWSIFRSKVHIQRSHPEHSNTRTKTSTSYKSTHRYNMR